MEAVKQITVNGRRYAVRMFSPLEAFDFVHDFRHAQRSGMSLKSLSRRAIGQCNDENGNNLAEAAHFESHFSKYPEDIFPLEEQALDALADPFLGKGSGTSANAKK